MVSISVIDTPVSQVMQQVAWAASVSISIPSDLDETDTMTADYIDQDAQRVFEELGVRIEMVAEYDGHLVTFAKQEDAQQDFVMLRTGYANPESAQKTMKAMLGEKAVVELLDDRLIVSGSRRALEQANKYAQHFGQGADGWLLDVRVVSVSKVFRRDIGLDWNVEMDLGINTTGPGYLTNADLLVGIIGKATETGTDAQLLQTATLYVLEGSSSRITQGQRVPVPRYTTSPAGTTTTTGFDYIDAGFRLDATARRVPGGVRLLIEPTISSVIGFVREAPITQESAVVVDLVVQSGDWIIISGLETARVSKEVSKLPGLPAPIFGTVTDNEDGSTLLVLVQARRVFTADTQD